MCGYTQVYYICSYAPYDKAIDEQWRLKDCTCVNSMVSMELLHVYLLRVLA